MSKNAQVDADFVDFLRSLPTHGGARVRIMNCFHAENIGSFTTLLAMTDRDLMRLPLMGRRFVEVLVVALADRGLELGNLKRCPTCGQVWRHHEQ